MNIQYAIANDIVYVLEANPQELLPWFLWSQRVT